MNADWCAGSYEEPYTGTVIRRYRAECPVCRRELRLVGRAMSAGWGRTRFPRHKSIRV